MTPERKVGTVVVAALLLLLGGVFVIGRVKLGVSGYQVKVQFKFVNDLKVKAAVKYAGGPEIGHVMDLNVGGEMVMVTLWIDREVRIRQDSEFWIFTAGMLGEQYLEVHASPSGTEPYLADGATVRGIDPVSLDGTLIKFGKIIDVLTPIFAKEEVASSVYAVIRDMRQVARQISKVVVKHTEGVDQALTDLESFSHNVDRLSKDLGMFMADVKGLSDPKNPQSVQLAMKRLNTTLASLQKTAGTVEGLAAKLDESQGLLGALINDEELKEDFRALVKKLKDKPITAKVRLF